MNQLTYEIALKDTCEQQLQLLKRGCCPSIAKGSFYIENNICSVKADVSGLFHLKTFLTSGEVCGDRFESSAKFYKDILSWLRKIIEAYVCVEAFLVPVHAVSVQLEDLYFQSESGRAVFLLKPSSKGFFENLCGVCSEIFEICPQSNADIIQSRLETQNAHALLSMQDLLRFLSSWTFEIDG